MSKNLLVDELLRLACIYAERDQLEYLDAVSASDPEEARKTRDYLKQLREYRMRKWGRTKLEAWIDNATPVLVSEIRKSYQEPQPTNALRDDHTTQ